MLKRVFKCKKLQNWKRQNKPFFFYCIASIINNTAFYKIMAFTATKTVIIIIIFFQIVN